MHFHDKDGIFFYVHTTMIPPSQEIVQKTGDEIRIRLSDYDKPDVQNVFRKYGNESWDDALIGERTHSNKTLLNRTTRSSIGHHFFIQ